MFEHYKKVIFSMFLGFVIVSCMQASDNVSPSSVTEVKQGIEVPQLDKPGYILVVRKNHENIIERMNGAADIEQQRAITGESVFHIASLSKQITAAALAHAIVDGEVSLEDPVSKWITETEKYGEELKVKHLVYMTSGLSEYTSIERANNTPWATFHYFTTEDAIRASLSVDELMFQPGAKWQYSNTNYMLIAKIVSKVYEKPFAEVVADKIFNPLGMSASLINDDTTTIIPNRANAYLERSAPVISEIRNGAKVDVSEGSDLIMIRRNAPHYGGSGVMTNMNDWSLWLDELLTHAVFGEEFWEVMLQTQQFDHDKTDDAFGLVHGNIKGRKTLWYEGGDIDVSSYSITFPDEKISVTCFSNNPLDQCQRKVFSEIETLFSNNR